MIETDEKVQDVLDRCTIEGNNVFLPKDLERDIYLKVNKKLSGIGGKWNRKEKAHVFPTDPSELMGRVLKGEVINLKKQFQFFETPPELADLLVKFAIESGEPKERKLGVTLEPSAGRGAIIDAIRRHNPKQFVYACEMMGTNTQILREKYEETAICIIRDPNFLAITQKDRYDTIVANPPFAKNADIKHVVQMYEVCKPGGRIVSITSDHWRHSSNKEEKTFWHWLNYLKAQIIPIDKGTFKSSGTMVGGNIIIINK